MCGPSDSSGSRMLWSTVSKAADKSSSANSTWWPLSICSIRSAQSRLTTLGHTIVFSGQPTQGMSGVAIWVHRKIAGALVGYEPVNDGVLIMRLNAKPRNITLIQVYGPMTAAMGEEMERLYQDLSQAVKQVPKGDMLLVMGDFNARVGRREPSAMSSAVGLYGLGETNEAVIS